jgi:hypothetical protein
MDHWRQRFYRRGWCRKILHKPLKARDPGAIEHCILGIFVLGTEFALSFQALQGHSEQSRDISQQWCNQKLYKKERIHERFVA